MKAPLVFALILTSCLGRPVSTSMIIQGEELSAEQYPAVVAVILPDGLPCSGTIVGQGTLLTAAHCTVKEPLQALGRPLRLIVRGDDSGAAGPLDIAVLSFAADPSNDPEALPIAMNSPAFGESVSLVGFGRQSPNHDGTIGQKRLGHNKLSAADELLLIASPIVESGTPPPPNASNIAGGDSGGPMLAQGRLIGVASGYSEGLNGSIQGWFVNLLSPSSQALLQRAEELGADIRRVP